MSLPCESRFEYCVQIVFGRQFRVRLALAGAWINSDYLCRSGKSCKNCLLRLVFVAVVSGPGFQSDLAGWLVGQRTWFVGWALKWGFNLFWPTGAVRFARSAAICLGCQGAEPRWMPGAAGAWLPSWAPGLPTPLHSTSSTVLTNEWPKGRCQGRDGRCCVIFFFFYYLFMRCPSAVLVYWKIFLLARGKRKTRNAEGASNAGR